MRMELRYIPLWDTSSKDVGKCWRCWWMHVMVRGDAVEKSLFYGPGASSEPTALQWVAVFVDVTRSATVRSWNIVFRSLAIFRLMLSMRNVIVFCLSDRRASWYLSTVMTGERPKKRCAGKNFLEFLHTSWDFQFNSCVRIIREIILPL